MAKAILAAAALVLAAAQAQAQVVVMPAAPGADQGMASAKDLAGAITRMRRDIGDKALAVMPVLRGGGGSAALEYWRQPLPPAVHTGQIEYVVVMQGSAKLILGGTMSAPHEVMQGLLQGKEIIGGTSRDLHKGDVLMIPAGTPHWFGPGAEGITLLGTKFAAPKAP